MRLTAKYLRDDFERKLRELQEKCDHPASSWMMSGFAPGHYYGEVLVCDFCEKVLESRSQTFDISSVDFDSKDYFVVYNSLSDSENGGRQ